MSPSASARPWTPRRRAVWAVVLGLACAALGLAAHTGGWLAAAEGITFDWRARLFATPAPADLPIRLILIDDESLEQVADWPWPRELYGLLVSRLHQAGARGVAFDLLMPLPAEYPSWDESFAAAMAQAGEPQDGEQSMPVVLPVLPRQESATVSWPPGAPEPFHLTLSESWRPGSRPRSREALFLPTASFPTTELLGAVTALGHARGSAREAGPVVRRFHPLQIFDRRPLPALGLALWAVRESAVELVAEEHRLRIGPRSVPLDGEGLTALRFRRPDRHLYRALSANWALRSAEEELEEEVRDAYVLVGVTADGTFDRFATPVDPLTAGVEIHATVLDNLIHGDFLAPAPSWVVAALLVLLAVAGAAATAQLYRPAILAAIFLAGVAVPVATAFAAYPLGFWWPLVEPTAATVLALVAGTALHSATEGRRRRFLLQAFGRYLSPVVVQKLIEDPSRLELGGERRELTIFFSDLEGFSTFAERLDPRELTTLLNEYLSEMTERILEEEGTLDKYEGDAILAFWNAPLDQEDHALRACRTALACQRRLAQMQDRLRGRVGGDLKMRIGIHSGPVVVGNLGSRTRFDYTVLGDAANLASRLEGANKAFGTYLMVSEVTWKQVADRFLGREIGELVVHGRRTPVRVFEPLGLLGEPQPPWLGSYRQGLEHLRAGRAGDALGAFETVCEIGRDPVAERYVERLRRDRRERAAGERWDGVWRLTSK